MARLAARNPIAVLGALSAAGSGCLLAYRPVEPHGEHQEDVGAELVELDSSFEQLSADVVLAAPEGTRIANAWLADAAAPPCSHGLPAMLQFPSGLWLAKRTLVFDSGAATRAGLLTARPTVVDLDVVPGPDPSALRRCLRLPLARGSVQGAETEPGAPAADDWRAVPPWFLSVGVRWLAAPSGTSAIGGGGLATLGGGVWVGPLRVRLDALVGGAGTDRPPPAGYSGWSAQLVGGAVAAEIFPLHVGGFGLGLQLGYEYLLTEFSASAGDRSTDVYDYAGPRGPRVAVRLARLPAPRPWPGFRARPDAWSVAVEVFAARWTGVDGLAPMHYGVALGTEWGRWW